MKSTKIWKTDVNQNLIVASLTQMNWSRKNSTTLAHDDDEQLLDKMRMEMRLQKVAIETMTAMVNTV